MNLKWLKFRGTVKGIFQAPIPYKPLLQSGDSSPYFGNFLESQRYGNWDTDCCWDWAFIEIMETRLCMLRSMNLIPQDTLTWLQQNGYIDSTGDFYLSRRWGGILSGVKDAGNSQDNAYILAGQMGLIPHSMLPYDPADALKYANKAQFVADYFNPAIITPAMRALGLEFLKRFTIMGKSLAPTLTNIMTYLHEGSLQIGVPAQSPGWNQVNVPRPIGDNNADHSVELYKYDPSGVPFPKYIYDSYNIRLKQLSNDYPIILLTRVYIWPKAVTQPVPLPQYNSWMAFWMSVASWIKKTVNPFPNVPIGSVRWFLRGA